MKRIGFGLIEVIVLLTVVSVIAVLTVKALEQGDRLQRVQETFTIIERTRLALYNTAAGVNAFRQRVQQNTKRISYLTTPITKADFNSCGGNFGNPQVANWAATGPYGGFVMEQTVGLVTPIGRVNDILVRTTPLGVPTHNMVMPNVDIEDVLLLDALFDAATGSTTGNVTWSAPVGGETTLNYSWVIDGTC